MIRCPNCGKLRTPVIGHYSRREESDSETIRYRKCADCGYNFKTHEWVVEEKKKPTGQRATFRQAK